MTAVDRIIFLGPSLPLDRAKTLLPEADFRPPIKRDDLTGIPAGTIVGIICGWNGKKLDTILMRISK